MFLRKKNYDLIFGLGEACSCSSSLRSSNLQFRSFPFDWIFGSTFVERAKILCGDFAQFIHRDALEKRGNNGVQAHLCDIYFDTVNGLGFNHDFPADCDLDEYFDKVFLKYHRRAERLLRFAKKSSKILVVWVDSPGSNWKPKNDEDFKKGLELLQNKFPKAKVDLLIFSWRQDLPYRKRIHEKISDNIEKYTFDYRFYHKRKVIPDYVVNEKLLGKILRKYQLKMTLKERFDNFLFKRIK